MDESGIYDLWKVPRDNVGASRERRFNKNWKTIDRMTSNTGVYCLDYFGLRYFGRRFEAKYRPDVDKNVYEVLKASIHIQSPRTVYHGIPSVGYRSQTRMGIVICTQYTFFDESRAITRIEVEQTYNIVRRVRKERDPALAITIYQHRCFYLTFGSSDGDYPRSLRLSHLSRNKIETVFI